MKECLVNVKNFQSQVKECLVNAAPAGNAGKTEPNGSGGQRAEMTTEQLETFRRELDYVSFFVVVHYHYPFVVLVTRL